MRLDLLVFADVANVDRAGKFNIIGEFNLVQAPDLPSPPVNMSLVARVVAEASEGPRHALAIAIVDEDGKQLARTPEAELSFGAPAPGTTGDLRSQLVLGMINVRFPRYGTYEFQVLVDGRFVGSRDLYVVQLPQPAA